MFEIIDAGATQEASTTKRVERSSARSDENQKDFIRRFASHGRFSGEAAKIGVDIRNTR
jgi:hypothetical protein